MATVNIWSVIVSAIVSFAIGALWYSPILFGKEWMNLTRTSGDAAEMPAGVWKSYLAQLILAVIQFIVLGFAIAAIGSTSASEGAFIGLLAWLGFAVPLGVSAILWKNAPFKLFLIETICTLLIFAVGGAIIGAWS